jgi:hypothetical protein
MSLHHNRIGFGSFAGWGGFPLLATAALLLTCAPASSRAEETLSTAPTDTDVFARVVPLPLTTAESKRGQLGLIPKPFPLHLRLGLMLSPRTKFDGGIDATLGRGILPSLTTRVDVDAIVSANFHGISTLVPLTLDQVYSKGLFGGNRLYIGAGVGPYISEKTRFGGKLFLGADLAVRIGVEGAVHFAGDGDPLLTLQARIGL